MIPENDPLLMQDGQVQEIHYLDERGNIITEEEYNAKTESWSNPITKASSRSFTMFAPRLSVLQFETNGYTLLPADNFVGQPIGLEGGITLAATSAATAVTSNEAGIIRDELSVQLADEDGIGMQLTTIDGDGVYGVHNALEAIDKVWRENRVVKRILLYGIIDVVVGRIRRCVALVAGTIWARAGVRGVFVKQVGVLQMIDGASGDVTTSDTNTAETHTETDSIAMYSDATSILYSTDPHYILSEAHDCFE